MAGSEDEKFARLFDALNEIAARQKSFEDRLAKVEAAIFGPRPVVRTEPKPQEAAVVPEPVVEALPATLPVAAESQALETKVGLTILNRIGVVTLVLGVAFFFKWAVDNNWVGPTGRVVLGVVAGLGTLGIADVLWRKSQQTFAQGITGAGIAIIYLSFYAAFDFYHLIPQTVAFVLLLATTAGAAMLALRYNAIAIAALGFFGAYLIPLLLGSGEDHPWFLLSYLLVLNFAAMELSARREWELLELLSFAATVLIYGGWLIEHGEKAGDHVVATLGILALGGQRYRSSRLVWFLWSQLLAAIAVGIVWAGSEKLLWFSLLVALGGLACAHFRSYAPIVATAAAAFWIVVGIWARSSGDAQFTLGATGGFLLFQAWSWWRSGFVKERTGTPGMFVFALNGVAYYALTYSVLRHDYHDWLGLLAVAVAGAYFAFAVLSDADDDMVTLAIGVGVAFLALAIPIQLSGFAVSMAWSILAAALTWIGVRRKSTRIVIWAMVVFALALARVAIVDSRMYPDFDSYMLLFNERFLGFAALGVGLLLSASWVAGLNRRLGLIHFISGNVVMLSGLSLEVIGWANRWARPENVLSVETIGISILFAVYAIALVSAGVAMRSAVSRLAGLVLTAVVILKLYLFDVWQLGRVYQIIAFVILGILLLSTSFLYSRFKSLIDQWRSAGKSLDQV